MRLQRDPPVVDEQFEQGGFVREIVQLWTKQPNREYGGRESHETTLKASPINSRRWQSKGDKILLEDRIHCQIGIHQKRNLWQR
jgi:hypothetical protein